MELRILTTFEGKLFDAYDIADLELAVSVPASEHRAGKLRFHVLLDIQNRWTYEDEPDIEVPDAVTLVGSEDAVEAIEGAGGFERTVRVELRQNFLDGLKDFASDPLWAREKAYELWVRAWLETDGGDEEDELEVIETRALPNPWA